MDILVAHLKKHLEISLSMLVKEIDACPDELWDEKAGGFVFWQQVLHALTGLEFWTRPVKGPFEEPFQERKVYPELEQEPEGYVSKGEMRAYAEGIKDQVAALVHGRSDEWLKQTSVVYDKLLNVDIIGMQIRHLQYHVGHCNSILRERGLPAVEWEEYLG